MKTQKTKDLAVPKHLQRLFVYSVVAAVSVVLVQQLVFAMMQFSSNPNLSGFYVTFLALGLMPVVMFIIAYMLVARKISTGQRIFESVVVAVSALAAQLALNTIVTNVFWHLRIPGSDIFGSFGLPTISVILVLAFLTLYLLKVRKSGRW